MTTPDQRVLLSALQREPIYSGSIPLYTGLAEKRAGTVRRQLHLRGLIEPSYTPGSNRVTWRITAAGEMELRR